MSKNFERVKRKLIKELSDPANQTQAGWCDIMLKAAQRCRTDDDQKDFFRFVLNPSDEFDIPEPTFMKVDTDQKILIEPLQRIKISDDEKDGKDDVILKNVATTNGGTTFIQQTVLSSEAECTS